MATLRLMLSLAHVAQASSEDLDPHLDPSGAPRRPLVAIDADAPVTRSELQQAIAALHEARAITVGVATSGDLRPEVVESVDVAIVCGEPIPSRDLVQVTDPDVAVAQLEARVEANPVAALSLAWLLRSSAQVPARDALVQESALFSVLLAGAEFQRWLKRRRPRRSGDGAGRVRVTRQGDVLSIVLDRASRRNAVDARMRDALCQALEIALLDPSLAVDISANGPCFSAGGDLDEFGTATDFAIAHLVRVQASPGATVHRMRERVTARLHGACIGAGIEIPAFAARVIAAPGAQFCLPEVGMGLIPGAGGTVSITRRVGRRRMLWMALSGVPVDVDTALAWGLIDAVK